MFGEAKREFVDLNVVEVSLVDSPANETVFAIIKSLNMEDDMAKEKKPEVTKVEDAIAEDTVATPADADVEKVPVEVAKADGDAVQKAMDQVISVVEGIAKDLKATTATEGGDEDEDEDDAEVKKAQTPRQLFQDQLKENGLSEEAVAKALEKFDAVQPAVTPVVKSEEIAEEAEADEVSKTLDMLATVIEKAKTFTPKRQEAIEKAIETLQVLLASLNPIKPPLMSGNTPGIKTPGPGFISGIQKMIESVDGLTKALSTQQSKVNEVVETNKALNERIETIEKTRLPSTSVDEDGGTDTEVKTEKSLWSGVL